MKTRRVRAYRIYPESIAALLSGEGRSGLGSRQHSEWCPYDADVVRFGQQWETGAAIVVMSHPSWPEVDEGAVLTIVDVPVVNIQ